MKFEKRGVVRVCFFLLSPPTKQCNRDVYCRYCRSVVQQEYFEAHTEQEIFYEQLRRDSVERGREAEAKGQVQPSQLPAQDKSQKPDSTSTL